MVNFVSIVTSVNMSRQYIGFSKQSQMTCNVKKRFIYTATIYIVFLRYHKTLYLNNSTLDFCMFACMTVHEKGAKMITHSLDLEP